jgi:hypothetical protein
MDLQDRENFKKGSWGQNKIQEKMAVFTAKLLFLKNLSKHLTDSAVFTAISSKILWNGLINLPVTVKKKIANLPVNDLPVMSTTCQGIREPLLKVPMGFKHVGHQKMHKRPQFHQVILERCTGQQKSPTATWKVEQKLPTLWLKILDVLSLVENQVMPLLPPEARVILDHQFVWGDAYVEGIRLSPADTFKSSFLLSAVICQDLKVYQRLAQQDWKNAFSP